MIGSRRGNRCTEQVLCEREWLNLSTEYQGGLEGVVVMGPVDLGSLRAIDRIKTEPAVVCCWAPAMYLNDTHNSLGRRR